MGGFLMRTAEQPDEMGVAEISDQQPSLRFQHPGNFSQNKFRLWELVEHVVGDYQIHGVAS